MSFSGGVFSKLYQWSTEQATPPIEIAKLDAQETDFATGLSNCILRDGTGVPTAATPWNSQNLTGVGALGVGGLATFSATTAFTVTSTAPRYLLNESDAASDEKIWVWIASGGDLFLGTRTDADGAGSNIIQVTRTGTTVDSIGLTATSVTYNGIEIGFRGIPQNAQTGNYTCVLGDAGKHIYHAFGDGAGDTYTIPANASVAYAVGTTLTFVNLDSNSVSIAITSDTLTLAGTTTTGTRTLAQNGIATAVKITSTSWLISGTGLS